MRTSRPIRIAALAGAVVVLAAIGCGTPDAPQPTGPAAAGATYVGRDKCVACHEDEGKLHAGSDHDLAMQPATPQTVVGDFGGSTFTHFGVTSTFSRRGDEYFAETDGPDGKLHEYKIAYTFGVRPLQQYLIEFPGGSYQALNVCWDTHDRADGGKRWFHLYPNEEVNSRDPLHWTGAYQNWNYMCAECHSTNLQKNWDPAAERYNTTWSEISVSCEACHGPGSNHVAWAEAAAKGTPPDVAYKGLVFRLDRRSSGEWKWVEGKSTAVRTAPIPSRSELETCARCHAERVQVWGDYTYGRPLADNYKIAFLDENLYYADGQIQGEVYEYDSFVQSKMFRAGVTCTNCHDPHSQKTWLEGNALCGQCHSAAAFDTTGHTFHKPGSEGSRCVECHMPSRNYMVVDPRRDHSYRVPRPDLSVKYGVPNACVTCHKDRTDAWAAKAAAEWWPRIVERPTYTEAIWAGRGWKAGAAAMLARTIGDRDAPAIVRATALRLIRNYPPTLAPDQLAGVLGDADPLVRRAGVELLDIYDPQSQLRLGSPLLADPMRTVRLAAALVVVGAGGSLATGEQGRVLAAALDEYRRSQIFNGDRAESHMNLGALAAQLGHTDEAEAEYRVERYTAGPELRAALEQFFVLHRLSHTDKARFMDERMTQFFRLITEAMSRSGGVELNLLYIDNDPAAAMYNLRYGNQLLVYNSGYDPALRPSLSSGIVLLALCIQSAIERGVTAFDFLQGNEEYKYRFGATDHSVLRLEIGQRESSNP